MTDRGSVLTRNSYCRIPKSLPTFRTSRGRLLVIYRFFGGICG